MKNLYNNLIKLTNINSAFYYTDQTFKNYIIRNFSYRLATYSDFQLPYAKYCRATAFYKHKDDNEWKLFCASLPKFFNVGEVEQIEKVTNQKIIHIFEKIDGNLIHFGKIGNDIIAKSKTSINSEHALKANEFLNIPEYREFIKKEIEEGFTPIFELVGREFKIVIDYPETKLFYLGSIKNDDFSFHFKETNLPKAKKYKNTSWDTLINFCENYNALDFEGFVIHTDKTIVKLKTKVYIDAHKIKENISNLKNLIPLILEDKLDDIYALFQNNKNVLNYINDIQNKLFKFFNNSVKLILERVKEKESMDRKEFALKYKNEPLFSLYMQAKNDEKHIENLVKQYILKQTNKQSKAKEFIQKLK